MNQNNKEKRGAVQKKGNSNRAKPMAIFINDPPATFHRLHDCLPTSSDNDFSIEEGHVISEVGGPETVKIPGGGTISAYCLRKNPAKNKMVPTWVPGDINVGDAYSVLDMTLASLPVIGEFKTFHTNLTKKQAELIEDYDTVTADALYIITVPCPIGANPYIHIYPPEGDKSTVTKGIRWKPSGHNTIAVYVEWNNDMKVVYQDQPRKGQSGLSINIGMMEDNSIETVNTPLNVTIYNCTYNLRATRFNSAEAFMDVYTLDALNFQPNV